MATGVFCEAVPSLFLCLVELLCGSNVFGCARASGLFSENSFAVVIVFGRPCQCALNHFCPSSTLTSSSRRPASLMLCDKRRGNLIIFSVHQIDSPSRRVLFLLVLQVYLVLLGRNKRGSLTGGGSICQWQPIRDPPPGRSSSGNTVNFLSHVCFWLPQLAERISVLFS